MREDISTSVERLREELGDEPWTWEKIQLAFAKVSGNMEAVIEFESDRKTNETQQKGIIPLTPLT